MLLHRYDGQLLYLKAAKKGLRYFIATSILCAIFKDPISFNILNKIFTTPDIPLVTFVTKYINQATNTTSINRNSLELAWLLTVSFLTVALAYSLQILKVIAMRVQNMIANKELKLFYQSNDIARIAILGKFLSDSPIDYMFYESFKKRKPILVTLKSKKVYVGIINKLGEPNESKEPNQEVSLVTAISGYRDSDTLEVKFTNNYEMTDEDGNAITSPESIHILRLEQIDSVCWYHVPTFKMVNGNMHTATSAQKKVALTTNNKVHECDTCKSKVKAKLGPLYILKD